MKRYSILLLALVQTAMIFAAEDVQFRAEAPNTVILDKAFQLTYVVNARSKDLRAPEMMDFDILAGPYTSTSSSTQWVNGKRTSSFTQTYTYTLMAKKEGTFTIPSASIMVDGEKYTSNSLKIKVLPPDNSAASNQNNQSANAQSKNDASVSNENIFIRTQVSKTKVYEQECILLTYRLYSLVDIAQLNGAKFPDFSGFLKHEIAQDGNVQLTLEHYNGRNYNSAVLHQTLLYPQHSGTIKIDPASFEAVVRVPNRSQVRSIFDNFFDSYTNVNKTLIAPSVTIQVEPLPAGKPTHFSGAVGRFNIATSITSTELKTNEAVTLKLTISGNGNMKFLKTPAVDFPEGFELYDPKIENNFKNTTSGVSGSKTIEYLAIPRATGQYTIPSIEFSYFDTQDKNYKTLRTPEYKLNVKKGDGESAQVVGNYVNKEDVKQISTDIRYIYTKPLRLQRTFGIIFGTGLFWLLYLVPLFIAILLFVFFRKKLKDNADIRKMRHKKANKVAQRRLKVAQKLWKEGKKDEFYDEILKASWTYISDKLSIPTANLNKENVAEALRNHHADEMLISEFLNVLNTCEFARYAPTNGENAMANLYEKTAELISNMEGNIK